MRDSDQHDQHDDHLADDEQLSDEEIEALLLAEADEDSDDEQEQAEPIYQRRWLRNTVVAVIVIALAGNILAFWPRVYSIAALQFLAKSAELYQMAEIQTYKEAVVIVKADNSKGTGFNISPEGLIVTNHHVIEDSRQIMVHFASGDSYPAKEVTSDAKLDIAVLSIVPGQSAAATPMLNLPVLPLAGQADPAGTPFYVIGNPLFFYRIANEGVLAGIHPVIMPPRLMLDAPIYSGNSGSPVINYDGEVIAVVYATTTIIREGQKRKVGLAIPIEQVHDLLVQTGIR